MVYHCLSQSTFTSGAYALVSIRYDDLMAIKTWRNEQIQYLRQRRALTDEDQRNYYQQVIEPAFSEKSPSQILFSFLHQQECIGYGGLTNIDWEAKRAEVSFLLDPHYLENIPEYQRLFTIYLSLLKEAAFQSLDFHRLFTETYNLRDFHVQTLEANGFRLEGQLRDHNRINGDWVDSLLHGCLKDDTNEHI